MNVYRLLAKLGAIIAGPILLIAAVVSLFQHDTTAFIAAVAVVVVVGLSLFYIHAVAWWLMR